MSFLRFVYYDLFFDYVFFSVLFFHAFSKQRNTITFNRIAGRNNNENEVPTSNNNNNNHNRLSWPQFYQRNRNNNSSNNNSKCVEEERSRRKEPSTANCSNSVALEKVLGLDEARAIQRANQIVMYVQNKVLFSM